MYRVSCVCVCDHRISLHPRVGRTLAIHRLCQSSFVGKTQRSTRGAPSLRCFNATSAPPHPQLTSILHLWIYAIHELIISYLLFLSVLICSNLLSSVLVNRDCLSTLSAYLSILCSVLMNPDILTC